jgi:hypothetical protein
MIAYEMRQEGFDGDNAFSDRQPFAIGGVDLYYKDRSTVIMLVDDPYRAWMSVFFVRRLFRCLWWPAGVWLMKKRVSSTVMDTLAVMPFVVPFCAFCALFAVTVANVPQNVSYHGSSASWSSDSTFTTVAMVMLAMIALALVAEWPLRIIRALISAWRGGFKPQATIAEVAAKAVPNKP